MIGRTMSDAPGPPEGLPESLKARVDDDVLVLTLDRRHKRNAIDDITVLGIERVFRELDPGIRTVVLDAEGENFSAGLDLDALGKHDAFAGVGHSRMWHRALDAIESGPVPVIAALKGAVVGGGLELAAACHLRVADRTAFFALPEGQRGIFVGGGGSVRLPRLIGVARMTDLMLTGRRLDADEAERAGLVQYVVDDDAGKKALDLARRVAQVAPQTTFAVLQALPRIAESNPRDGYLLEAMTAAIAQSTDDAKRRMTDFLEGRAARVTEL